MYQQAREDDELGGPRALRTLVSRAKVERFGAVSLAEVLLEGKEKKFKFTFGSFPAALIKANPSGGQVINSIHSKTPSSALPHSTLVFQSTPPAAPPSWS